MGRRNWEHLTPFFAYPADIRKVISTTHAIESLNMPPRKVIKTRGRTNPRECQGGPRGALSAPPASVVSNK
jgi:transposase-like protein